MKVVIDIPPDLLGQVREIVSNEDYDSPQEFINVALMNQVEMEASDKGTDEIVSLDEAMNLETAGDQTGEEDVTPPEKTVTQQNRGPLERRDYDVITTVAAADRDQLADGPLWGQYNRLFPVKLTLRRLANYLSEDITHREDQSDDPEAGHWAAATQFKNDVATVAREFGDRVGRVDERRSRTRMEKLATGLPVGDNAKKSKERYKRHFVGTNDQSGAVTGAPPRLLFANLPASPSGKIGITEAGLRFANLWNPLLDEGVEADRSFSEAEIEFYLEHIREKVPDEHHAMQIASQAIVDGINRPDSLTDRISGLNDEWSSTHADTVRSGLVSRMVELGLVSRERVGQRGIAYNLTASGEAYLNSETTSE